MTSLIRAQGVLALCALAYLGSPAECLGGTLRPDQLVGVTGVVVSATVYSPELESYSRSLEVMVAERARTALSAKGIRTSSEEGLYLRIRFTVKKVQRDEADEGELAAMALIQLVEPVVLKRDPGREVPGGGALTWWAERLEFSKSASIEAIVGQLTDELVARFITDWEIVNEK